jgi:uncharacterized protein (UPF0276 family)
MTLSVAQFAKTANGLSGGVGIGWRQPHYAELLARQTELDFLEVHSENFFGHGGPTGAIG